MLYQVWFQRLDPSIFWCLNLFFLLRSRIMLRWCRIGVWGSHWQWHRSWFPGCWPYRQQRWRTESWHFSFLRQKLHNQVRIVCSDRMMVSSIKWRRIGYFWGFSCRFMRLVVRRLCIRFFVVIGIIYFIWLFVSRGIFRFCLRLRLRRIGLVIILS